MQTGAFSKCSNADAWAANCVAGFDKPIVQMDNLCRYRSVLLVQNPNSEHDGEAEMPKLYAHPTTQALTASTDETAQLPRKFHMSTFSDARWSSWGNGADRVNRLKQAGYDPAKPQSEVNKLF